MTSRRCLLLLSLVVAVICALCATPSASATSLQKAKTGTTEYESKTGRTRYEAKISTTELGLPHIEADNYSNLGFGYGTYLAKINLCLVAGDLASSSGHTSLYYDEGDGSIEADAMTRSIYAQHLVAKSLRKKPPIGPSADARALIRGTVAGFNNYIRTTPRAQLPAECRNSPMVHPITVEDFWIFNAVSFGPLDFAEEIGSAAPPLASGDARAATGAAGVPAIDDAPSPGSRRREFSQKSNNIALGRESTVNGSGLLLSDSHWGWDNGYIDDWVHFTIPGELNTTGSTYGQPVVSEGVNDHIAWTETSAPGTYHSFFKLDLVEGDPFRYIIGDKTYEMKRIPVEVQVRDGEEIETVERTIYRTKRGYVLNTDEMSWTEDHVYTVSIVPLEDFQLRMIDQPLAESKARNIKEFLKAFNSTQGLTAINQQVVDGNGRTLFTPSPNIINPPTGETFTSCLVEGIGEEVLESDNAPVLDGSRPECNLQDDADALSSGAIGTNRQPIVTSTRAIAHANGSHWYTAQEHPLTGYSRFFENGREVENGPLSARTRLAFRMINDRLADTDGIAGDKFSYKNVPDVYFQTRNYSGELMKDDVATECAQVKSVLLPTGPVDISGACPVLREWDAQSAAEDRGAVLWRVFYQKLTDGVGQPLFNAALFKTPFDLDNPVNTPRDLDVDNPAVMTALAQAVQIFNNSALPLDISIGEAQIVTRGDRSFVIEGCPREEGCFRRASNPGETRPTDIKWKGSAVSGSSMPWIAEASTNGVRAKVSPAASSSRDPRSPFYNAGTVVWEQHQFVAARLTPAEVARSPQLHSKIYRARCKSPTC